MPRTVIEGRFSTTTEADPDWGVWLSRREVDLEQASLHEGPRLFFCPWRSEFVQRIGPGVNSTEEKLKSALADPPTGPIQDLQGYREGEMAPVISFQDRGHGMTTERRTMAFFYARWTDFLRTSPFYGAAPQAFLR